MEPHHLPGVLPGPHKPSLVLFNCHPTPTTQAVTAHLPFFSLYFSLSVERSVLIELTCFSL